MKHLVSSAVVVIAFATMTFGAQAATTQSYIPSVATSGGYSANFDGLSSSSFNTSYSEGGFNFSGNFFNFDMTSFASREYLSALGGSDTTMYQGGQTGALTISTGDGSELSNLSFAYGTGYGNGSSGYWEAYRDGGLVGSGLISTLSSIISFSDTLGFDALSIAMFTSASGGAGFGTKGNAIAIDYVNGQQLSAVPLPPSAILFGSALFGLGYLRRRKQHKSTQA